MEIKMKPYAKQITICTLPGMQVCHEKFKTCEGCDVLERWNRLQAEARTV
jgi:hypothetical protein